MIRKTTEAPSIAASTAPTLTTTSSQPATPRVKMQSSAELPAFLPPGGDAQRVFKRHGEPSKETAFRSALHLMLTQAALTEASGSIHGTSIPQARREWQAIREHMESYAADHATDLAQAMLTLTGPTTSGPSHVVVFTDGEPPKKA